MSILNVSITPDAAVISVDNVYWYSGISDLSIIDVDDPSDGQVSELVFKTEKQNKPSPTPFFNITKLAAIPHMKAVTAFCGRVEFGLAVRNYLSMYQCRDITVFENECASALSELAENIDPAPFVGALIGWSEKSNGIVGFQFRDSDGFKPHRFQHSHGSQPPLNPADKNYEALTNKLTTTNEEELLDLHLEFSKNQHRAFDEGLYGPTWYCGDKLIMAAITAEKTTITEKNIIQRH